MLADSRACARAFAFITLLALTCGAQACEDENPPSDASGPDLSIGCPTGQSSCAGECVDASADRRHCGTCGHTCDEGFICVEGSCALTCQAGLTSCGDDAGAATCTNLATDRMSCGACGAACASGSVCAAGSCAPSCPSALTTCTGADGAVCTDVMIDPRHCGACDHSCSTALGAACLSGHCVPCADGSCRVAFVTSTTASGNLGGLHGADLRCQALAQAAGLVGSFRAWLSSSTVSAADRLAQPSVPYLRPDGVRVADGWTQLTSGAIQATIDRTETGASVPVSTIVFTGTLGDGTVSSPTCADWNDGSAASMGVRGVVDDTDDEWTNFGPVACDQPGALYCLQQ